MTNHIPDGRELADEMQRLQDIADNTADGTPCGNSETQAAFDDFVQDNLSAILSALRSAALPKQSDPGREELALVTEIQEFDSFINQPSEYEDQTKVRDYRHAAYAKWSMLSRKLVARIAAKPVDDGARIPFDADAKLGYVWLIWGVTQDRVDLIAIATTDEACSRYLEAGKLMNRYRAVKEEQAFVDHLYGGGLLKAITNARLPLSPPSPGERK